MIGGVRDSYLVAGKVTVLLGVSSISDINLLSSIVQVLLRYYGRHL